MREAVRLGAAGLPSRPSSWLTPCGQGTQALGGSRVLAFLMVPIALAYGLETRQPELHVMIGLLSVSMICLGLGNGAVFQMVPLRFGRDIGVVTGVIGAVGGIGGTSRSSAVGC